MNILLQEKHGFFALITDVTNEVLKCSIIVGAETF